MKDICLIIAYNIPTGIFAIIAGKMAFNGVPWWGWFLAASIACVTISTN